MGQDVASNQLNAYIHDSHYPDFCCIESWILEGCKEVPPFVGDSLPLEHKNVGCWLFTMLYNQLLIEQQAFLRSTQTDKAQFKTCHGYVHYLIDMKG
jgi:hypothetical protein